MREWIVVVPVKGATGKSRLEHPDRAELATAIALDTIEAASRAERVAEVVVVTSDAHVAAEVEGWRDDVSTGFARSTTTDSVRVIPDPGAGLNAAIAAGIAAADATRPRAVLLGDLPALDPRDLDAALDAAASRPLSMVPDVEGRGTTLVTARPGVKLEPAFGDGSAARHRVAGFAELHVPAASTLRRDVDTADQLRAAAGLGLGPRTSALR
ncbi:2-phospho-L-lactate guanylyltransferase [Microbacterium sp. MEC084]|uniref:2-phospho-L-lactate guanylyltransferase n=1 Tax=Microbacterium sp. MEC084 TaxID=1963027 RepID=UPI00106F0CF7|nr:2-phospho-L-lactate guanylyltransferase [Microbacterium sp. MEC084]MCD1269062.1 2-phospho-L-lactate guanylyltransferase [Microbacterium sp. MEC084]